MKQFMDIGAPGHPRAIVEQLVLDAVDGDVFRNRHNQPNAYQTLFGGQVLAQALAATDLTVDPERSVHSLHAYFLRGGKADQPIDFAVERIRDGSRFSTRRVVAMQGAKRLLSLDASFAVSLPGFEHQQPLAVPFCPEDALDSTAMAALAPAWLGAIIAGYASKYPIDIRVPEPRGFVEQGDAPRRHYWMKARGMAPCDDQRLQRQVLCYLSDFLFAGAPFVPHTRAMAGPHLRVASLDHGMWFHRPVHCEDWLLFVTESPNARGSINLSRGLVYDRAGNLVATMAQESLQSIEQEPA